MEYIFVFVALFVALEVSFENAHIDSAYKYRKTDNIREKRSNSGLGATLPPPPKRKPKLESICDGYNPRVLFFSYR